MAAEAARRRAGASPGPHEGGKPLAAEVDLTSRWLGSSVLAASDESFGEKENILKPGAAAFEPGHYGNRGEIVDGWETRRRREPGHDWAIVRLGAPGIVTSVDIDTSFFTGNFPESCIVEALGVEGYPAPKELASASTDWVEIVPRSPLRGDAHNTFPVADRRRFTHVRLSIFPDGGVARLRILGRMVPDPRLLDRLTIDLASQEYGSGVSSSSDGFYTSASLLNRPDTARTMGEGWETRRRRDSGHDFVVVKLGFAGRIRQAIVDTAHFKYNASAEIALYGSTEEAALSPDSPAWIPLLDRTRLQPDTRHVFPISANPAVTAVRLDAYPDGGLSRVRLPGTIDPAARRLAGRRWFNALPEGQAGRCLDGAGVSDELAKRIIEARPLAEDWRQGLVAKPAEGSLVELSAMIDGPDEGREPGVDCDGTGR